MSRYQRSGKWTPEEEVYCQAMIEGFHCGELDIECGLSLRQYIAKQVICSGKRVSKKFEGTNYQGKNIYVKDDKVSVLQIQARKVRLIELERRFLDSVDSTKSHAKEESHGRQHQSLPSARVCAPADPGAARQPDRGGYLISAALPLALSAHEMASFHPASTGTRLLSAPSYRVSGLSAGLIQALANTTASSVPSTGMGVDSFSGIPLSLVAASTNSTAQNINLHRQPSLRQQGTFLGNPWPGIDHLHVPQASRHTTSLDLLRREHLLLQELMRMPAAVTPALAPIAGRAAERFSKNQDAHVPPEGVRSPSLAYLHALGLCNDRGVGQEATRAMLPAPGSIHLERGDPRGLLFVHDRSRGATRPRGEETGPQEKNVPKRGKFANKAGNDEVRNLRN